LNLSEPSLLLPNLPRDAEILVARLRSLGDIVLETPAIAALHDWRPDLRIFALIEERFAAALEGNPCLAGMVFSRGFAETTAALRQRRLPILFNQHGGPRSALLTAASGAKVRVGWKGFQYSFVYNVQVPDASEFYGTPIVHTVEHRLSQFYWAGLPRGPIPQARIFPQPEAAKRTREVLAHGGVDAAGGTPYAVLQPEARLDAMRWPPEKFVEIARWLREKHAILSILNIASAGPAAAEIRSTIGKFAVVPPPFGLPELIALISGASLFIGNDSGPVHIAAALGTPSVVIYGPTNPAQWHPWQTQHRAVTTGAEFRAIRGDKSIALKEPRPVASIAVEEVRAACQELITCGAFAKRRASLGCGPDRLSTHEKA
jgi:heptosyltransferase III